MQVDVSAQSTGPNLLAFGQHLMYPAYILQEGVSHEAISFIQHQHVHRCSLQGSTPQQGTNAARCAHHNMACPALTGLIQMCLGDSRDQGKATDCPSVAYVQAHHRSGDQ